MYNIVGALFAVESEAYQAMTTLSQTPEFNGTAIYQMTLIKRENGALKVCDNYTSSLHTADDTVTGGLVGALVGILGGPLGVLLGGTTGALVGSAVDAGDAIDGATLIEQAAQKLEEGDVALIALVDEADEAMLDRALVNYNVVIVRYDADAIAREVEEAQKMEKEMARQARAALRAAKKQERQERREARHEKLKASAAAIKEKLNQEI